jgi:putative transposase
MLHVGARFELACPIYILIPDHWHLVWMGMQDRSDQHSATRFLRKNLARHMGCSRLQDRAHDHVLRPAQRKQSAFMAACSYVCANAVRARLVNEWHTWPYLGAMVPGYPDLDPRTADFWEDFWKIYNRCREGSANRPASPEAGYERQPGANRPASPEAGYSQEGARW